MKITFLTPFDAKDVNKWSGTPAYMAKYLEQLSDGFEYLGSLRKKHTFKLAVLRFWYQKVLKKQYLRQREPEMVESYARQAEEFLRNSDCDVIVAPWPFVAAGLKTDKPLVLWTDATFEALMDHNRQFRTICKRSVDISNLIEKKAFDNCSCAVFSSNWAANSAITYYGVDPDKVKVIPFGANIECSRTESDIRKILENKSSYVCKLLFLGRTWEEKGGPTALNVARELNARGVKTELTIVGCSPGFEEGCPEYVNVIGFIDKASDDGYDQLDKLLSESHFLILPTPYDAYGIVFCEASSFGLPSIALNRGGVPVKDGINGLTFEVNDPVSKYCDKIEKLISNRAEYNSLAFSSFKEYQENLNWDVASQRMMQLLRTVAS